MRWICPSVRPASAAVAVIALALLPACSGEDATPVDLDDLSPSSSVPEEAGEAPDSAGDETNAASRELARRYAEQQCFDDLDAEVGVIEIVHPDTDQVVARIEVDCEEVRSANPNGLPEPPPSAEVD